MKIGLIVGSLRKESWNKQVALTVKELFPDDVEANIIDISNVPLYNQDLDAEVPNENFRYIREEVKKYDGFIFFTPEYNRSYTPAIKNIIDVVSRDPEGSGFKKKPATVFSASIGGYGAMAANLALRQAFVYVDLIPMQQPEVYLSRVQDLFDDDKIMVEDTRNFLKKCVLSFVEHAKLII
ncbi:NAD(P)H-dependent oxidoreductase [Peptostreptococcus porci]|uniref:NADPH-dependent FMN reductase n=1 Tax=Peptostreptococcus porci TaxID=2652282 RepID=UPI002A82A8CB|nr:NAD(P)H-dependent oxidoreductase [Peptostreptococcus porci]MDY4129011.1 NAD(P)H-dependent oxidoreductase [Peptostreptococcus porci]